MNADFNDLDSKTPIKMHASHLNMSVFWYRNKHYPIGKECVINFHNTTSITPTSVSIQVIPYVLERSVTTTAMQVDETQVSIMVDSPDVILCGWLGLKHQLTN